MENKRESILKGIISLLISQVFIKIIGLIYKLYLTNREGFGDSGNPLFGDKGDTESKIFKLDI